MVYAATGAYLLPLTVMHVTWYTAHLVCLLPFQAAGRLSQAQVTHRPDAFSSGTVGVAVGCVIAGPKSWNWWYREGTVFGRALAGIRAIVHTVTAVTGSAGVVIIAVKTSHLGLQQ